MLVNFIIFFILFTFIGLFIVSRQSTRAMPKNMNQVDYAHYKARTSNEAIERDHVQVNLNARTNPFTRGR